MMSADNIFIDPVAELSLLNEIEAKYGYKLHNYQEELRRRRIVLFMSRNGIECIEELRRIIVEDQSTFARFISEFTVSTTELFRDPAFYPSFAKHVLPYLSSSYTFKIWHAGCSTGEEVYSMAIFLSEHDLLDGAILYGTDINAINLEKAKRGMVRNFEIQKSTGNYFKALGLKNLTSYWVVGERFSKLKDELLRKIVFSGHNLVSDYGFGEMDVICAKNVLIYFDRTLKDKALNLFYRTLRPYGYLCLGSKESLVGSSVEQYFDVVDRTNRIYRKRCL